MQQTALNLLAIGIFAMTLSVLLAPILNMSPAIPAATTFVIMGLFTVDTLAWGSRGVTLLLDLFSTPQRRERIVHHEAGHFLAAYFLGIPIAGYTLTAWEALRQNQPGLGGVAFDTSALAQNCDSQGELALLLDRFCTVWMAGIAAETQVYGQAVGGGEDRHKLRTVLKSLGRSEPECQQKERWAQLQAKSLLERHQAAYESLVKAMSARASVRECCQAIQQQYQRDVSPLER